MGREFNRKAAKLQREIRQRVAHREKEKLLRYGGEYVTLQNRVGQPMVMEPGLDRVAVERADGKAGGSR